ncbi:MAG: saccharopine dehydrogenase [Xanthomonadales bacterium]|nr:saccharopine dehydrogenase NADP-binding domain-containing protein [Gammaproteobacteria bacterium]MBT8053116.1 saccharopine dehydrogenase NADP-binding domain-containing protein [Gammaproteobacteria bacterium]NND56232.1 saccharopine dehydrogenase [Xanthomonadales bacterium]NNK52307.1 saccharopine dehydrogenase [Xanthomonadales bacterium]
MPSQKFDLIVFGATSFVGEILCRYLVSEYGVDGQVRWAAAGRSREKLEKLRSSLGSEADQLELLTADAGDESALKKLCDQTRVIISTVGPYALHGEPLVRVCVTTGTDYCDLAGEVQWVRRMISRYEDTARETGARIVHCCGFDSIPSDMGVWHLQQAAQSRFGESCDTVRMRVKAMRGSASGGTIASILNITKEAAGNPELRKELSNPYSICPAGHGFDTRQYNVTTPEFDSESRQWAAPFIMAGINTRVVHRSNALGGNAYGKAFRYDESMLMGKGTKGRLRATGLVLGLGAFLAGAAVKPTRWLMKNYLLPKPGEGPSPEAQKNGFYDIRFFGKTASGERLRSKVTGDLDPGYGSTSKMLAQSGLSLAFDVDKSQKGGGFWTTATIFDQRLIDRLEKNAGLTFTILD